MPSSSSRDAQPNAARQDGTGDNRTSQPEDTNKWFVLGCVIFGIFMVILDTTVVNVAFATLRQEFHQPLSTAQWIVSVYVLALGMSTPAAGFLADKFGMKRVYIAGLLIFITGSAIAGLAPNIWILIAARAVQAAGGGICVPLGTAFLFATFPPKEQGTALGFYGIGLLAAPAVGPILGGTLVDRGLWRWIFFINIPVGLVGALLGAKFLPYHKPSNQMRTDWWGLATSVVGFGALLVGASIAAEAGWTSLPTIAAFATGIVCTTALVFVDLFRADDPLLDFTLYKNRVFLTAALVGYVSVLALFGAEFLMPLYLQTLRGLDALSTGLVLLPLAITAGITTPAAGRLYDRIGPRALVVVGFSVLAVNTWQLSRIDATTPLNTIRLLMALRGFALGCTVQSTFTTALGTVDRRSVARGSSLVSGTRFVVQSIGVAILSTILYSSISPATRRLQEQLEARTISSQTAHSASRTDTRRAGAGGVCGTQPRQPATAESGTSDGRNTASTTQRACQENLAGFERAYRFTFYMACVALLLGALLPGWPFKWEGRGKAGNATTAGEAKPAAA